MDLELASLAAKLSLSQCQKKKKPKQHRKSRKAKQAPAGAEERRQEGAGSRQLPSTSRAVPGLGQGRRWQKPRSPAAHAAAPPGRGAAAAAEHPQRASGKFPRRPDGRAGSLLPLVQSTTCFGLHLVTGSMAGPSLPAPAPAPTAAPPAADSPPLTLPSRQRRPGPPLPRPGSSRRPQPGPPRCRSAPWCRVPPGPRAWESAEKNFQGFPLRQVRRDGDSGVARHPSPGAAGGTWGGAAARRCALLRWWLRVSHSLGAILASECLEPRLSPNWHLGFLFLNPAPKSVLGCGGWFARRVYFYFALLGAALSHQLHLRLAFLVGNLSLVSWPPSEAHGSPY